MHARPPSLIETFGRLNRDVRLYVLASGLIGFTIFGGIDTVILNLYLLRLGYDPRFIGWVNATGALTSTLVALPAGLLGFRAGRRHMMMTGMALLAIGMGALPVVEYMPIELHRSWILVTRGISYLGLGIFQIGGTPFLMGATKPEERHHAYALHTAIGPLAGLAGGLVGGLLPSVFANGLNHNLTDTVPYQLSLWVAALVIVPGFIAVKSTSDVVTEPRKAHKLGDRSYRLIFLLIFVSGFFQLAGERVARTYFNVYMNLDFQSTPAFIGTCWAIGHLLSVVTALMTPYLCRRWGIVNVAVWGAVGMVVSLLLMAWVPHPYIAGLAFVGIIGFAAIRRPPYTIHHQELVTSDWRPAMAGVTALSAGSSEFTMSLLGGYTIASLGFTRLFETGAVMTGFGALLFWLYFRHPRGERHSEI